MGRIGKCPKCKTELYLSGKNYFSNWEQHKCSKCSFIRGGTYQEYLEEGKVLILYPDQDFSKKKNKKDDCLNALTILRDNDVITGIQDDDIESNIMNLE